MGVLSVLGGWVQEAGSWESSDQVRYLDLSSQKAEPGAKLVGYFLLGVTGPSSTSDGAAGSRAKDAALGWLLSA